MVASDMENGESLIDVIDGTSELFGNSDGPLQSFNWADEFLGENEAEVAGSPAVESGNLATSGTSSLSQNFTNVTSSTPSLPPSLAASYIHASAITSEQTLSTAPAAMAGQTIVNPLQTVGQGLTTQIVQGNQQFILKTANGPIQFNPQLQFQQQILQASGSSGMSTTSTPFQSPAVLAQQSHTGSPSPAPSPSLQSRAITPNTGSLTVSYAASPSSQAGTHFKSTSPSPNVNIVHLPTTLQQHPQLQLGTGAYVQMPGAGTTQNLVGTAGLLQGQSTLLPNQAQNLVNTQNTVIQNPNVVNVNVAHVLCPPNNAAQQHVQNPQRTNIASLGALPTATPNPFNIQGTLIQTAEGKSLLIPSQQMAQPINIQNIQQLAMPTQIGQHVNPNIGSVGNVIRLAQSNPTDRTTAGVQQMVVNQNGQQVLINRPQTAGQSPNIILRTIPQSGVIQLQQPSSRMGSSPVQTTQVQAPQTAGVQVIGGSQGQQFKIINPGTTQGSVPLINIGGGQSVSLQQLSALNPGQLGSLLLQQQQQTQPQPQPQQLPQGQVAFQTVTNPTAATAGQQQVLQKLASNVVTIPINSSPAASQPLPFQVDSSASAASVQQHLQTTSDSVDIFNSRVAVDSTPQPNTQTLVSFMQSVSQAQGNLGTAKQQNIARTLKSMQVPVSNLNVPTSAAAAAGCSTAQSTAVTTTVSLSATPMSQSSVSNSAASGVWSVSSVGGSVTSLAANSNSSAIPVSTVALGNVLSSQKTATDGPTLQTIQLSPEQKQKLAQVQSDIKKLQNTKNVSTMQKQQKLQQLYMLQRKILMKGQVIMTTKAQPHLLQKQGIPVKPQLVTESSAVQSVVNTIQIAVAPQVSSSSSASSTTASLSSSSFSFSSSSSAGSNFVQPSLSSSQPTAAAQQGLSGAQQVVLQQSSSQPTPVIINQQGLVNTSAAPMSTLAGSQMPSFTPVASTTGAVSVDVGSSGHSLSSLLSTSVQSIAPNNTLTNTNNSSMAATVKIEPMEEPTHNSQTSFSETPPSTTIYHRAPATAVTSSGLQQDSTQTGTVPTTVSSAQAVPTQIKIGNKVLTLNLTPAQRDKVQGYLDRMTPEQQQTYLQTQRNVLNRIQKQQQINAQIRAQVQAQRSMQASNGGSVSGPQQPQVITLSPTPKAAIVPKVVELKSGTVIKTEEKEVTSTQVPKLLSHTPESDVRGQKRPLIDIPKGTLINQQLRQDQNQAVNPDTKKPFRSRSDACRRLMRYHVFQSHGPKQEDFDKFDGSMESKSLELLKKKVKLTDRFRTLLLQESLRVQPSSELVMIQRMANQDLKKTIEEERQIAANNPEDFEPMPLKFLKKECESDLKSEPLGNIKSEKDPVKMETADPDTAPGHAEVTVKVEPNSDSLPKVEPSTVKMKRLVIKSDGQNFSSSFRADRTSTASRDSEEGGVAGPEPGSIDQGEGHGSVRVKQEPVDEEVVIDGFDTVDQTLASPADYHDKVLDNFVASSDAGFHHEPTEDITVDRSNYQDTLMQEECERAAMVISSADESESATEDTETDRIPVGKKDTDYPQLSESPTLSFSQSFKDFVKTEHSIASDAYQNTSPLNGFEPHSNLELASESIYYDQTHDTLNTSLNSSARYSQLSRLSSPEESHKYISEHSPVSPVSNEADNAIGSIMDFENPESAEFYKKNNAHVYQPITESLTDSEENSYNSADTSVDQGSVILHGSDKTRTRGVNWEDSTAVSVDDSADSDSDSDSDSGSESEHENDTEVKAQMQSAIDSILSLNQGAPSDSSMFRFDHQSASFYGNSSDHRQEGSFHGSSSDIVNLDDDDEGTQMSAVTTEDSDEPIDVDNDLDAAVQSILM